jgi:3D (Asp-Asp-Asp) domain-containing protein
VRRTTAVGIGMLAATLAIGGTAATLRHTTRPPLQHEPVVVYSPIRLPPVIVTERPKRPPRGAFDRARDREPVRVLLTAYCLQGTTRRGRYVRQGIIAADPRIFPLSRYLEVFVGERYFGRFLVDDTGKKILGAHLDLWMSSCDAARLFGTQWGTALLVPRRKK